MRFSVTLSLLVFAVSALAAPVAQVSSSVAGGTNPSVPGGPAGKPEAVAVDSTGDTTFGGPGVNGDTDNSGGPGGPRGPGGLAGGFGSRKATTSSPFGGSQAGGNSPPQPLAANAVNSLSGDNTNLQGPPPLDSDAVSGDVDPSEPPLVDSTATSAYPSRSPQL